MLKTDEFGNENLDNCGLEPDAREEALFKEFPDLKDNVAQGIWRVSVNGPRTSIELVSRHFGKMHVPRSEKTNHRRADRQISNPATSDRRRLGNGEIRPPPRRSRNLREHCRPVRRRHQTRRPRRDRQNRLQGGVVVFVCVDTTKQPRMCR
jgi:hypothetical protein